MIPFCCHQKNRLQNYFLAQQDGTQNVSWLIERAAPGGVEDEEVSPFAVGCSNFSCRYVMLLNRAWKTLYGRRVLFFFSFSFLFFPFRSRLGPPRGRHSRINILLTRCILCIFLFFPRWCVSLPNKLTKNIGPAIELFQDIGYYNTHECRLSFLPSSQRHL